MLKTLWSSSELTVRTKIDLLVSCVFSRLLYAAETWTIKAADSRKLLAFEMRCYRQILRVCWKDRVSNKTIRERVERHHSVVDLIKQWKLRLFGHICRMKDQRLVKTVMLEMVEGERPVGRPSRRWSDDITDWCNCTLPEAVQLANNSQQWRIVTGLNGLQGSWVRERELVVCFIVK